jgi:hypothetical protein
MAASQKQIDANRENAKKSTGPKTPEGKAQSSRNALKHGLTSPHTIMPHEDGTEYHEQRAALLETWQPANAQELQLVDAIAAGWLRMQRSLRFEASTFEGQVRAIKHRYGKDTSPSTADDDGIAASFGRKNSQKAYELMLRYQMRAESGYYRAIDKLRAVQNDRLRRENKAADTVAKPSRSSTPASDPRPIPQIVVNNQQMGSFGQGVVGQPATSGFARHRVRQNGANQKQP